MTQTKHSSCPFCGGEVKPKLLWGRTEWVCDGPHEPGKEPSGHRSLEALGWTIRRIWMFGALWLGIGYLLRLVGHG